MATFTLRSGLDRYPQGTTIRAYPQWAFPGGTGPTGDYVDTATQQQDGTAEFTNLVADTSYVVAAELDGQWVTSRIRTGAETVLEDTGGPLDIWRGMDYNDALGNQPDTLEVTRWQAGVWSVLEGHGVTREVLGQSTEDRDIVAFTAGNPHGKRVLMTSGIHAGEQIGLQGGFRYFEQFAKSTHPAIVELRDKVEITWISCVNVDGFPTTRRNANGVDINRNHNFHWLRYAPGQSIHSGLYKGPSVSSEVETQLLQEVLDLGWDCVIDCHDTASTINTGPGASTLQFTTASPWVPTNRAIAYIGAQRWRDTYPLVPEEDTLWDYYAHGAPFPNLTNHAAYQMAVEQGDTQWNTQGRLGVNTFLVEAGRVAFGCVAEVSTSDRMMRLYCGLIHSMLTTWVELGSANVAPQRLTWVARRIEPDYTTSVSLGGTKLDMAPGSENRQFVYWDAIRPESDTAVHPEVIGTKVLLPRANYGHYSLRWYGTVASQGSVETLFFVTRTNGVVQIENVAGVTTHAGTDQFSSFGGGARLEVTPSNVDAFEVEVGVTRDTNGTPADLRELRLDIELIPFRRGSYITPPWVGNAIFGDG